MLSAFRFPLSAFRFPQSGQGRDQSFNRLMPNPAPAEN
jgi:hypothetical protein